MKYLMIALTAVMLSGCTTPELVVNLYQDCTYRHNKVGRDGCIIGPLGDWLNAPD